MTSQNPFLKPVALFLAKEKQAATAVSTSEDSSFTDFSIAAPGILLNDIPTFFKELFGDTTISNAIPENLIDEDVRLTYVTLSAESSYAESQEGDITNTGTVYSGALGLAWENTDWELIPGFLSIDDPAISIDVAYIKPSTGSSTLNVSGSISSFVEMAGLGLVVTLDVPSLRLKAEMPEGSTYSLATLMNKIGLPGGPFEKAVLQDVMLLADVRGQTIATHFELLEIDFGVIKVADTKIDLMYIGGTPSQLNANLFTELKISDSLTMDLSASHGGGEPGWQLDGSVDLPTGATIGGLMSDIESLFDLSSAPATPDILDGASINSLAAGINTATHNMTFDIDMGFELNGTDSLDTNLSLQLTKQAQGGYETNFTGQFTTSSGLEFDLIFDKSSSGTTLLGLYQNPGGGPTDLSALLADINSSLGTLAKGLNFKIKDVLLAYKNDTDKSYLFMADIDFGIDLSGLGDLPIIGAALPKDQALAIAFQPLFLEAAASNTLTTTDITSLLPDDSIAVPDPLPANSGFQLITTIKMGGTTKTIDLNFGSSQVAPPSDAGKPTTVQNTTNTNNLGQTQTTNNTPATPPANAMTSSNNKVKWIDLQRHFGPLHFRRVGIGYDSSSSTISGLLDAGIAIGPLQMDLMGLGVEYNITSKQVSFSLEGLGLDFKRPPLEIGGAFLRMDNPDGSVDFAGRATLKLETFALTALGMYGKHNGTPSLFLYAFIDYPLGGPDFFFVKGVAVAFGLNRRLITPPIEEIHTFPLVSEVIGQANPPAALTGSSPDIQTGVKAELESLEKYIPFEDGRILIAAGLRFTTFEIIDTFALAVVQIGHGLEIEVMGVSTVTAPPNEGQPNPEYLAEAQLEFKAWANLLTGEIGAQANLTPNSYILSKSCVLQGGFAFAAWMMGPYAGDFVYTLGGYHPHFNVPSHYPQVRRLGFNWHFDGAPITIKGEAYYALTGRALMAGGGLEAVYQTSSLKAWFDAGVDVLMVWKPFHYEAGMHIEVGVEATVHVIFTFHVSLHLGAELSIWGPPFAGKARLKFIITVTVSFGPGRSGPPPLSWSEFSSSFLPTSEKVSSIAITNGLVRSIKETSESGEDATRWIINSKHLELVTDSKFPCQAGSTAAYADTTSTSLTSGIWADGSSPIQSDITTNNTALPYDQELKPFGVDPMQVPSNNVKSTQIIGVMYYEAIDDDWKPVTHDFIFIPQVKQVPTGMWNPYAGPWNGANVNDASHINAITGYAMHPATPPKPNETYYVLDNDLRETSIDRTMQSDTLEEMKYTVADVSVDEAIQTADVATNRSEFLTSLGFDPAVDVDLYHLSDNPHLFVQPPVVVSSTSSEVYASS